MALPEFTLRQLLEAGVHFGHQTHRWNPKMSSFIFGARNNIHIVDLAQTVPLMHQALLQVSDAVAKGVKPEALRAKVLADLAARSDAAGIIATAPAAGAKESPIVAAAKKSAAASR